MTSLQLENNLTGEIQNVEMKVDTLKQLKKNEGLPNKGRKNSGIKFCTKTFKF